MAASDIRIIAVDDKEINLMVLEEMARDIGFEILTFLNPLDALNYVESNPVDILFADYMMPEMNGITLIKLCKVLQPDIIAVMITAVANDSALKIKALEEGTADFLTKPIDMAELKAKLKNLSELKKSQKILKNFNEQLQEEVRKATQTLIDREYETLRVLSNTAEYRDPETASHIARVANYSQMLARLLGMSKEEQEIIFYASPLHDIGKVGISDNILLKPGKLTDEEFAVMKKHPNIGYEILRNAKNIYLQAGAIISITHHEKYDGSGYPEGLSGENIHIYGRITAIADVFDALTSVRPYKKAWNFEDAMQLIREQKGGHFDPVLADLFIDNVEEVRKIYQQFEENDTRDADAN